MKKEDLIILIIGLLLLAGMLMTLFFGGEKSRHGVGSLYPPGHWGRSPSGFSPGQYASSMYMPLQIVSTGPDILFAGARAAGPASAVTGTVFPNIPGPQSAREKKPETMRGAAFRFGGSYRQKNPGP